MEHSIDNLWFYDLPSPPLEFSSEALEEPPSPDPNRLSLPSCDLDNDKSPQIRGLHRAFDVMDADRDGELTGSELCIWMKKLGLKFTEEGMLRLIDLSDARRCGSLDFKEFVSLNSAIEAEEEREELTFTEEERKAAHQALVGEVFELFDRDHNGLISPKDLSDTLESLRLFKQGSELECADMIKGVDLDGDGQVSFSEFENMMDRKAMHFGHMDA